MLAVAAAAWTPTAKGALALVVTRGDDPVPDGCAPGDCSLREAVIAANEDPGLDEVRLPAGLYELSLQGSDEDESRTGTLDVRDPLSVVGAGADTTVIDLSRLLPPGSTEAEPLFVAFSTELSLSGVTVRGGRGGVISAESTTVTISASVFSDNSASRTAVLSVGNQTSSPVEVVIEDSVFERNTSENGAIVAFGGPTGPEDAYDLTIRRSRFSDNQAFHVLRLNGSPSGAAEVLVEDSLFERNRAVASVIGNIPEAVRLVMTGSALRDNDGGVIGIGAGFEPSSVRLDSVEIARNTGGGIYLSRSGLNAKGVSLVGNQSERGAGALVADNGSFAVLTDSLVAGNTGLDTGAVEGEASLVNTTVSGNRATAPQGVALRGGFFFNHATVMGNVGDGGAVGPGEEENFLKSDNSVLGGQVTVAGERAPNCAMPPPRPPTLSPGVRSMGNLLDDDSCGAEAAAGRVVADVGVGPLADNGGATRTHLPSAGGPAIDSGGSERCPAADQRGVPRPRDGDGDGQAACDVGAVEVVSAAVRRVSASDRVATAVAVSRAAFADRAAGAVVLARADGFADGLAGAPLAAGRDAPLLLSDRRVLDPPVEAELARVLPPGGDVYLLGGQEALSAAVEQRVAELGWRPLRVAGGDRYATAVAIAERLGDPQPLLLTAGDELPQSTADYLARRGDARRVAVGGPAAAADPAADPIVGVDRYATAVAVAERLFDQPASVGVASGADFPDALAGGADSARRGVPLLLSPPDALPAQVGEYLADRADQIETALLYGGARALDLPVELAVADAIH